MNPFENKWLLPAVIGGVLTQLSVVYIPWLQTIFYTVPLSLLDWALIFALAPLKLVGIEIAKKWFIKSVRSKH